MNKHIFVSDRIGWKEEYGTFMHNLGNVMRNILYIHKFIELDKKSLRIIDYGCSYGYYLRVLKMINPKHDLYGVDVAKEAIEASGRVIGADAVFWKSCDERLPIEDNSVDIIYSFDMLEHVKHEAELTGFFKECNRMIKKDGLIFITTPNCNWYMRVFYRLIDKEWICNPKLGEHSNPFTEKRFRKAAVPFTALESVRYDLDTFLPTKLARLFPGHSVMNKAMSKLRISLDMVFVLRKSGLI